MIETGAWSIGEWMFFGNTEVQNLINRGYKALQDARVEMEAEWGFGNMDRWDADLNVGTITFTNPGLVVVAPVQIIGSFIPSTGSWLWSWANECIKPTLSRDATLVRDYAWAREITPLFQPELTCIEDDGWLFTAMASALAGTGGAYRGAEGDDLLIFMTFGTPTVYREQPG